MSGGNELTDKKLPKEPAQPVIKAVPTFILAGTLQVNMSFTSLAPRVCNVHMFVFVSVCPFDIRDHHSSELLFMNEFVMSN